jgi:hypothetical protein
VGDFPHVEGLSLRDLWADRNVCPTFPDAVLVLEPLLVYITCIVDVFDGGRRVRWKGGRTIGMAGVERRAFALCGGSKLQMWLWRHEFCV